VAEPQRRDSNLAQFPASRGKPTIVRLPPDEAFQPDPELALSEGKTNYSGVVLVALAIVFIVGVVLYGITA
jgi:hypothetical protein